MRRVFVGLSGGVDSGVSALLLKERGFDVTGVFIKIWQPEFIECTWREDRLDAMRVCAALGIPYREIDLSDEYKREVVDDMVRAYEAGRTPNPDVLCNRAIKFGSFMQWAFSEGADLVATGHYARSEGGRLLRGIDTNKDQSYFLYRLTRSELERILFPVGDMRKDDVRKAARRAGLPVAQKPDSQGLCFVGDVSLPDFLKQYIALRVGAVLDQSGEIIGEHDGAALYTLGQRHGFRIIKKGPEEQPHYVVRIDTEHNTITVSHDKREAESSSVELGDLSLVDDVLPEACLAQSRYRDTPISVKIARRGENVVVDFTEPHIASPGQSLVFYQHDECIGGGVIKNA